MTMQDFDILINDEVFKAVFDKAPLDKIGNFYVRPRVEEIVGWLRHNEIYVWVEPSDNGYVGCVESEKSSSTKFFSDYKEALFHAIIEGVSCI